MAENLNQQEMNEVEQNYYGRPEDLDLGNLDSQSENEFADTKEGTDAP